MSFSFPEEINKALSDFKIKSYTPIQEQSIPLILNGKNLVALSETGSGKTLAYILPLISKLIGQAKRPTKVLIITPTKELSEQILSVAKATARHTPLICTSLYGGVSFSEQEKELKKGVHLIVACPGRLKDHIEKKTIDLSGIETLVLDEADQLMDMGFYPHLKIALEASQNRFQTLLFSATMNEDIKTLSEEFLSNYETIEISANKPKEIIEEFFCPISPELRYPFFKFLLKNKKIRACLVFTTTKEEARMLNSFLNEDNYKSTVLEGDMTTHQRKKSLNSFKEKILNILVATDVASRGLDIPHVTHVINFTPPPSSDSYVHRIGRTARHEKGGMAITLYTEEEAHQIEALKGELKLSFKPSKFKDFNYQMKVDKKSLRII